MIRLFLAAAVGSSFGADVPSVAPTSIPTVPTPISPTLPPTPPPTLLPTAPPTVPPQPTPSSVFKGDAYGHLSLNSFVPYPGGAGSNVSGYVLLTHMMDTVTINYKLMGVDAACTERLPGVGNSCGLHIHVGFSCETDLAVGIHYYDESMEDPWVMGSYYKYDPAAQMAVGEISLKYGFGVDASKGHAFVVHDAKGTRIACGVLSSTTDKVTLGRFAPYPMYEGPLKQVDGCVHMDFRGVSAKIAYDLAGVDPLCTNPSPDIPNSCGLHIHAGMTCTNASEVGGHYFDVGVHYFPSTPMPASGDPWSAAFVVLKGTRATGTLQVDYGFGFDTSRGRAVVLHDYNGTRVACALLPMYADRETTPLPALTAFPGYEGPPITGSVQLDFRGEAVKILYNLSGTEPMCAKGVPGSALNSCGIHIHMGLTCAEAGGHYFDVSKYAVDPWQAATYKAGPSSLIVGYGYSFEQTKGRTVVIHNYNGTKVACATIPATSSFSATVTNFLPLPGTTSPITPTSTVLFDFRPTSVRMTYNLMGVEAACINHNPETKNSCGLHIHEGYSCTQPGGHFFNGNVSDPWAADYYMAAEEGKAIGHIDIEYGYGFADSRGRAVVIHNYAGEPVACSTLPTVSDFTEHAGLTKLVPLPGPAMVNTSGTVLLSVTGLGVKMDYALTDVEAECAATGPAPLSCGIHIHKGFSCDEPLTHFYNNVTFPQDPWMYASYVSTGTMASGSVVVSYGESWALTEGRVVVVHNYAGAKVACAVIPQTTDQVVAKEFKYLANETYTAGAVQLDFRANSVLMTYNLAGVDPTCTEPGTALNSCGLHIHNGTSCADASQVGAHYYDSHAFDTDPWATVVYKSDDTGHAMGMVNVEFGYDYTMTKGRVVVLHDKAGTKILCAPIPTQAAENSKMTVSIPAIAKYPAYTGPYAVGVSALALEFNGVGTKIVYNLTGVPCECSQMGTAPNSCGLHIHEGLSCLDAALVGGHWYNKTMIANDPWLTTTFTSRNCADTCLDPSVGTSATGAVTVDYGYGAGQTLDKVMVVHDYLGNRIACAPISSAPHPGPRDLDMAGMLAVSSLPKYPASTSNYGGNVTGGAQLQFMGTTVTMIYHFEDVDPLCIARNPGVLNSCGMHIHSGWSCDAPSLVGPHFYQPHNATDPWQESYYVVDAKGSAHGEVAISFGYTIDETKGRTFVLHDYAGVPMTCSVLGSTTDKLTLGTIMRIPKYAGTTSGTAGCINLDFRGSSVAINYNLTKVDPECVGGGSVDIPNSCGIHINEGMSCDNATATGGAYYSPALLSDVQPWKYVNYSCDKEGNAKGALNVEFGYGFDMSQGRAFVLYDAKGNVMTCNLIPVTADRDVTPLPQLTRIPSYNGSVAIEGSVKLDFRGHGVKISYALTGLEPTCQAGPGPNPNSCGIHIHSGFTCEKPGPHFYNSAMYPKDPWSAAVYLSQPMAKSLIVSYGFDFENTKGRTVVVHNYDGVPVACSVIPATTDRATAINFVKIGTTGPQATGEADFDFRATSVRIHYNIQHVDPACTQPMPGVVNSCGLHIHEGMSCENNGAQTGPHYFNTSIYTMDPWANVSYTAVGGNTAGFVDVENGYGYKDTRGRAFVLHDVNGEKMACAIISTGNAPRDTVAVVNLMPLAPTPIQGKVLADFQGMGVKLSYDLVGVETNCSTPGDAKLSCGLHIHEGFDCNNPMGHYYNNATYPEDPWMYATYTALGSVARGSFVVSYGADFAHTMGRALVVHNYAGAKVACQTLPQMTTEVTVEGFKPLNESRLAVAGYVRSVFRSASVRLNYLLQNVDPRCVQRSETTPNSCGLHIHNGTCTNPGGHYYNTPTDPWAGVYYVATSEGLTAGSVDVEFGFNYEMTKGKIMIVHDQAGTKVSCAEIGASLTETISTPSPMRKYPGYEGLYVPHIQASMKYSFEAVTISYNLSGIPCECSQIGTAPNSCGLHIHEGASCDANAMVGGHWFNNHSVMSDPWAYTPYTALKCSGVCLMNNMGSTAAGSLTVVTGYDYAKTVSRVLVVHDYMGTRIGCAPLAASEQAPATSSIPWVPILGAGGGALILLILIFAFCRRRKSQRARVGTLNEKLAPTAANANGNPTRRTLSVNRM